MTQEKPSTTFPSSETRSIGIIPQVAPAFSADVSEKRRRWAVEDRAKLLELCEYYGIEDGENMFFQLSLILARQLFPERKKPGRKSKWSPLVQGLLVADVDRTKGPGDPSRGVAWACQQLARREPWRSFLETKDTPTSEPDPGETLRTMYHRAEKGDVAAYMRNLWSVYNARGDTAGWERQREYLLVRKP